MAMFLQKMFIVGSKHSATRTLSCPGISDCLTVCYLIGSLFELPYLVGFNSFLGERG